MYLVAQKMQEKKNDVIDGKDRIDLYKNEGTTWPWCNSKMQIERWYFFVSQKKKKVFLKKKPTRTPYTRLSTQHKMIESQKPTQNPHTVLCIFWFSPELTDVRGHCSSISPKAQTFITIHCWSSGTLHYTFPNLLI